MYFGMVYGMLFAPLNLSFIARCVRGKMNLTIKDLDRLMLQGQWVTASIAEQTALIKLARERLEQKEMIIDTHCPRCGEYFEVEVKE